MDYISQQIFGFLQTQIENTILGICNQLFTLIATGTAGFWNEQLIKDFIDFSKWANMVVFAIAVIFMLFDMSEEFASGKNVDFSVVFANSVKAMIFVQFNALLAEMAMSLSDMITTNLNFKIPTNTNIIDAIINSTYVNIPFDIFVLAVVLIATVVFFVMTLMRYGAMFVHILSSSLYISDILRGDSTSMGSWLRQMVAIAGTYTIQYITFYTGLYYLLEGNIIICCILWAGMIRVSKILQKFGYSTGTSGVFSTAGSLASQGISLVSKV